MTPPRHSHTPLPFALDEIALPADGVRVIAVRGELDLFTAPELRSRLRDVVDGGGPVGDLVVDLADCTFVDASGCQVLLRAARQLTAVGRRLAIVNTDEANSRIFSVMGLHELFPVVASRSEAITALQRSRRG